MIVNPDAFGLLGDSGRQVVLTHETAHVATRAHTSAATPLWLSEGYADWAGYRGAGRDPAEAAPELAQAVGRGEVPDALPEDDDFGFTGDAEGLARAYESSWLACRMIADRWGEERLGAFYRAVGAHEGREGAVEDAMRGELGVSPEEFTLRWRDFVRDALR
ncbi:Lipoprotein OS=Streptomyces tendae OX=1932 GN=F3L20_24245 PE=4 SV=1 [Streptomyces tendae]